MTALNQGTVSSLPSIVSRGDYDRSKLKHGIAHIGVGAFHRAHQAIYLDRVLEKSKSTEWGLIGIGLLPFDAPMRDAMTAQNGLYTVNELSANGDRNIRLVQCMTEYLYAPGNYEAVIQKLTEPNIRIVSMTITEGGYLMDNRGNFQLQHPIVQADLSSQLPQSALGIIIEALHRRRQAGTPPFTVMSCDNLRHNGDQAKKATLAFANARDPQLASWIEKNVSFPNGMVDRITPAMNPELRDKLNAVSGVNDMAPVISEDFIQWVLEDNFVNGRPDWALGGVTLTSNVTPYEEAKIRLLNGSHQMLSYPSFLSGLRRVDIALQDPLFFQYIHNFLNQDSGPWLSDIPGMELGSYKKKLLERFGNSAIGDQLARLCLDGGSKIPGFLLPTIHANLKAYGRCPRLAFLLASYNHYIHTNKDDQGDSYELKEPNALAVLQPIIDSSDPLTFLKNTDLVGDAANYPEFVKEYLAFVDHIQKEGNRKTLEKLDAISPPTH